MLAPITIRYPFAAVRRSLAVGEVADLFGLDGAEADQIVAENLELDVRATDVVLFVGPSGSGKSSVMRAVARRLGAVDAGALELPAVPLVEALPGPVDARLATLAGCGLSEARLLLRTPAELSDGQRYRFRMAYALATANGPIVLDEFTAALDRTLAKVVAFNLRKLASRSGAGVLCATTHEDIAEDLNPDVLVRCLGDGEFVVEYRAVKKKPSASTARFGSRTAPDPTGRTSLGGITAGTASGSPAA
jgi:ABC-type ATPase with predicted acetyltransferase domain